METPDVGKAATGRPRGKLISAHEAAKRIGVTDNSLRRLLLGGVGPPAIKRPGSNRWLFWSNELEDWLESGRATKPRA